MLLPSLLLLWLQLYWALVPTWQHGEYYSYGFFVPVLAAGLAWRRWGMLTTGPGNVAVVADRVPAWVAATAFGGVVVVELLQVVTLADPAWRPPLVLQAAFVFGLTHLLIAHAYGKRISWGMLPVTIFALCAVPYPWQIEQHLIRSLTGSVISLTREVFLLTGTPVEVLGERLTLGPEAVDVTDGCSGIRSFQSLIMGALFIGELLLLSLPKRLVLLLVAVCCAVVINTGRAYTLAVIHFQQGKAAAAAAHDFIGHTAYWLSIAIVFFTAYWSVRAAPPPDRRLVRRVQSAPL